jgi:hypothetical protein
MPAAAIPLIGAAVGAAGSAGSAGKGKKSANSGNALAQQQLQLQQQQFGLAKQQTGFGNAALGPSTDYWKALLNGGQAAVQATGPYASLIGQAAAGTRNSIQAGTARGGEQNLALAQNSINQGNNVARLYAGMQPLAAQGLASNAGAYFGSGAGFNPQANTGGAFGNYANQGNMAASGGAGFGSLLYNSLKKFQNRGGSGGGSDVSGSASSPYS